MPEKSEMAVNLYNKGYNCAQSVAAVFSEETGIERDTLLRMAAGFGSGVAGMRQICGAVSGMMMILGLVYGSGEALAPEIKTALNTSLSAPARLFEAEFGCLSCGNLLAKKDSYLTAKEYCGVFVHRAVELTASELKKANQ